MESRGERLFWSHVNSDPSLEEAETRTHRWLSGIITIGERNDFKWHNSSLSPMLVHELEELDITYIQKWRRRAYPLEIWEDHTPHIIANICVKLLNCTLEPRRGCSCKLSQPADKTPLELRWYLGDWLLLLLVQQCCAHTELSCNDRSGYIEQQGDTQLRSNEEVTWNIVHNLHTNAHIHILVVLDGCENVVYSGGENRCSRQLHIGSVWLCRKCNG